MYCNLFVVSLIDVNKTVKGFQYQNATELEGVRQTGIFGSYEGGGYVYRLGVSQNAASKRVDYLKANNWIDEYTRAIFVEFTTFNNQMNLYTVSFIVFELAPTGG